MIDLHCHILPGLDDGPATLDDSLAMCRMAAADGIRTLVAATHFRPGWVEPSDEAVQHALDGLRNAVGKEGIPIEIIPGAEVTITPELVSHLSTRDWLFINRNEKYFIAEFGQDVPPQGWSFLFSTLLRSCRIPVLTHPERCAVFRERPDLLRDFVERGGLIQITAASLLNESGEDLQELAADLLKRGLVHVIATDAHSTAWRPPLLSAAVARAALIIGRERAEALVTSIPQAIIEGRTVVVSLKAEQAPRQRQSWMERLRGLR